MVVPLDWGLGHATRCIPIISCILHLGCTVIIGAEGAQKKLLQEAFPEINIVPLKGYRIRYTKHERWFSLNILLQLPKIVRSMRTEYKWLQKVVKEYDVTAVISDNRYGLFHKTIPSVIITHQLQIKAPYSWVEKWIRKINYNYINRFHACWVPDEKDPPNLAGALSHPSHLPATRVSYLGGLSRFETSAGTAGTIYDTLIIISGPEPQRSVFEDIILLQLKNFDYKALLVRGLPKNERILPSFKQVTIVNHLPAAMLSHAFQQSEYIISRSGYTTVMDIIKLQKKAILVPTPGQTEQQYLAFHLQNQRWCLAVNQDQFSLAEALQRAGAFDYRLPELDMEKYKKVVGDFIAVLSNKTV